MAFIGSALAGALGSVTKDAISSVATSGLKQIVKEKNILVTSEEPTPQILTDSELKKKVCGKEKKKAKSDNLGISKKKLVEELRELKKEKYNKKNKRKSNLGRLLDRIE